MSTNFSIGDKVELTKPCRDVCVEPDKYKFGIITSVGTWNIYDVKWNGIDYPIGMKRCEIQLIKNKGGK